MRFLDRHHGARVAGRFDELDYNGGSIEDLNDGTHVVGGQLVFWQVAVQNDTLEKVKFHGFL